MGEPSMYPVFSLSCCLGLVRPEPQMGDERETRIHVSFLKLKLQEDTFNSVSISLVLLHLL